jgi:hypothetical protein
VKNLPCEIFAGLKARKIKLISLVSGDFVDDYVGKFFPFTSTLPPRE